MDWVHGLAADAARVTTPKQLIEVALNRLQALLEAPVAACVFTGARAAEPDIVHSGLRQIHVEEYMTYWRSRDPILAAAVTRRLAVRDADVPDCRAQTRPPICFDFAKRLGVGAYLVAPVYGPDGGIAGTFHLCRRAHDSPFRVEHVEKMMVFSGFLSAMLARLHVSNKEPNVELAPREYQVALLAGRGLTNPDIARQLGLARETVKQTLRRVYRKASVGSRTELAVHLARLGWL
jgi:DNA-binding CsgD family transcriptional regulator